MQRMCICSVVTLTVRLARDHTVTNFGRYALKNVTIMVRLLVRNRTQTNDTIIAVRRPNAFELTSYIVIMHFFAK